MKNKYAKLVLIGATISVSMLIPCFIPFTAQIINYGHVFNIPIGLIAVVLEVVGLILFYYGLSNIE